MKNAVAKKPVNVFNCGPIKAAIWADSRIVNNAMVEVHSVRIDKSFKDGEEWKHTNTFNIEDLPKVSVVAMEIYRFLRVHTSESDNNKDLT